MSTLRVAVVGYGRMGRCHADNVRKLDGLTLCAVIDPALPQVDDAPVYAGISEALDKENPDVVVVAVHTFLHYQTARIALEHGCHVLVEKPLTLSVEEGRELIELARARNLKLMVGHCLRFFPAYRKLREFVENGKLGKLRYLKLFRHNESPAWGDWTKPEVARGSGGALFDLAIHDIDFTYSLLGEPESFRVVHANDRNFANRLIESFWMYPDNVEVAIESGGIFPTGYGLRSGGWALFEKGALNFNGFATRFEVCSENGTEMVDLSNEPDGYYLMMEYFTGRVRDGGELRLCPPEESLHTIELCHRHRRENFCLDGEGEK